MEFKTYKDIELNRLTERLKTVLMTLEMLEEDFRKLINKSEEELKQGK